MPVSSPLYSGDATVGVVVPLYNSKTTINETLASIVNQTYRNLDILVVDDGSSDNGPRIVEQWSARDHRVRLIRQTNAGVAAARNIGAAAATGEYLAFCDADDLWAPRKIELQLNALAASAGRSEYVYCWYAMMNAETPSDLPRLSPEGERPGPRSIVPARLRRQWQLAARKSHLVRENRRDSIRHSERGTRKDARTIVSISELQNSQISAW